MSAKIFSLAAKGRPISQSPDFTPAEKKELYELASDAIGFGAVRDSSMGKRDGHSALILKNGIWEAAPDIAFVRLPTGYFYFREGGEYCSTPDFEKALTFAREDLRAFGAQVQHEVEQNARNISVTRRRQDIHLVRK